MSEFNVAEQLDIIEKRIMSGLKDFQRFTVERIAQIFKDGNQRRILVSDEVGLGKTLIARGTVAKVAKIRKYEGDNLVKVVYICSNAAIAEQNLQKLSITREAKIENSAFSRLSMQHLLIFKQEHDPKLLSRYIQLIPLTPDTSFKITTGTGTYNERALMYVILRRLPELSDYLIELKVALTDTAYHAFESSIDRYEQEVEECNNIPPKGKYLDYMFERLKHELDLEALKNLCQEIRDNGGKRVSNKKIIGQLRVIFAKISLEKLEPDLVIMDEFQRFKYLLNSDPETETGMLANKFFHSKNVRMLLLSATPYKMYSTAEEIDETRIDEHYTEFLSVMKFLNEESDQNKKFLTIWKDYSIKLKELTLGHTTIISAEHAASDAGEAMYNTVCRTERFSEKGIADIIKDVGVSVVDMSKMDALEPDIQSYIETQKLLDLIGDSYHVPVDYTKSSPYLLSFMKNYQLKKNVENYFSNPEHLKKLKKKNTKTLFLDEESIKHYKQIPYNNARLEQVMKTILSSGEDKLLWIPPSRPYYKLQGAYKGHDELSKTLIFSSWEMVPRMLSSLISYEVERRTVGKLASEHNKKSYFKNEGKKRYPAPRLIFTVKDNEPSGMNLFCLIYPSKFLSDCYNPIECMNEHLDLADIQRKIKSKISDRLSEYPEIRAGLPYYLAPLLLDDEEYVMQWLENGKELSVNDEEDKKNQKRFNLHLSKLKELYIDAKNAHIPLGRQPDDLLDVLTDMAIASPAICINRTYNMYLGQGKQFKSFLPSQLARVFLNRMNTPESISAVELACGRKLDDAYWQNLLAYCKDGNLQAVFDEYAHLISCGLDHDEALVEKIHRMMKETMTIRTAQYEIDTYKSFNKKEKPRLRTHYAVAFTRGEGEGKESDTSRKKTLRNAFNSPFRPFVLATTSIGQEGLDFHNYCRKIVHWNLPSNPIDLEQREGRINRFECLAIRQNVAKRYGDIQFQSDIWKEMFDEASQKEKTEGSSDLIPFWGLRETDDMVKIERIFPMYPFSRDEKAYERLIKILSMYRLTLGQPRQEELLEYLFKNYNNPEELKKLFINLSPFYKKK